MRSLRHAGAHGPTRRRYQFKDPATLADAFRRVLMRYAGIITWLYSPQKNRPFLLYLQVIYIVRALSPMM